MSARVMGKRESMFDNGSAYTMNYYELFTVTLHLS